MKIATLISIVMIQTLILKFDFLFFLDGASQRVHDGALAILTASPSPANWFLKSILLGERKGLHTKEGIWEVATLGFMTLFLVSGKQLSFFDKTMTLLLFFLPAGLKKFMIGVFLFSFLLANNLYAPVLRAFVKWILATGYFFDKKNGSRPFAFDLELLSCLTCLLLRPSLAHTFSFQFSAVASCGFTIAALLWDRKDFQSKLTSNIFVLFVSGPFLLSIQKCVSWMVIPSQLISIVLFKWFLMPLATLCYIFPSVKFVASPFLEFLLRSAGFIFKFSEPRFCFAEKDVNLWGGFYVCAVFIFWRSSAPFFIRARFWKDQENLKLEP